MDMKELVFGGMRVKKITGYHGTKKNVIDAIVLDNFKVTEEKKTDNH